MDANAMSQIVQNLGFPIVMSLLFFWLIYTTMKELTKSLGELKESVDKLYAMITHMENTGEIESKGDEK